ncbi:hypothetical protein PoB_001628600 [Plakobranchus ocellatus]|uniref:Uncharacterized protein n=1 Tax=Plakobranchus ocellatus TaxID=259542 RepID=A0AAV3YRL6_9GAST|nr:hypothetical protein PoB_001628600 [Plakobranchus ocellatus]
MLRVHTCLFLTVLKLFLGETTLSVPHHCRCHITLLPAFLQQNGYSITLSMPHFESVNPGTSHPIPLRVLLPSQTDQDESLRLTYCTHMFYLAVFNVFLSGWNSPPVRADMIKFVSPKEV